MVSMQFPPILVRGFERSAPNEFHEPASVDATASTNAAVAMTKLRTGSGPLTCVGVSLRRRLEQSPRNLLVGLIWEWNWNGLSAAGVVVLRYKRIRPRDDTNSEEGRRWPSSSILLATLLPTWLVRYELQIGRQQDETLSANEQTQFCLAA